MFANFDFDVIVRSLPYLFLDGMTFTLTLTALATLGGLVFGTLLAMMRLSGIALLSLPAAGYVNLMRSVPLVLMIFWFDFLVPYIGQWLTGAERPIQVGYFASSLITFTLFEAAYFCEIMRAGIQSIPLGHIEAGRSCGMPEFLILRRIVLPQVVRRMLPEAINNFVSLFKATTIVSLIAVPDLMYQVTMVIQQEMKPLPLYTSAALTYFAVIYVVAGLVRLASERWRNRIYA